MTATRSWRIKQMENITIETTKPAADAHLGATKTKLKKACKRGKAAKKASRPRSPPAKLPAESINKKADVIPTRGRKPRS